MLSTNGISPRDIAKMTKRQVFAVIQEIDEEKRWSIVLAGGKPEEEEESDGIWL